MPGAPKKSSNKALFIVLGVVAALAIAGTAAWFFLRGGNDSNIEKMIPATAAAVLRVDGARLATNMGLELEDGTIKLPERVKTLVGSSLSDLNATLEQFKSSGINPMGNIYAYAANEAIALGVFVPLDNEEKAKQWLTAQTAKTIEKGDGYDYIYNDNILLMIKNKTLFLAFSKDNESKTGLLQAANDIMDGKREGIGTVDNATKQLHAQKALTLYLNNKQLHTLLGEIPEYQRTMNDNPLAFLLNDIKSTGIDIDFDNNELQLTTNTQTQGNDLKNFCGKMFHKAGDDFLKYLPAGTNAIAAVGINGKEIVQMQQIASLLENEPQQVRELISHINGTLALAATVDINNPNNPTITVLLGVDDPNNDLSTITSMIGRNSANMGTVGNYIYMTTASGINADGNANLPSECRKVFSGNLMGLYTAIDAKNFTFNFDYTLNSAESTEAHFFINENGKKMKPAEWPVAFMEISKNVNNRGLNPWE